MLLTAALLLGAMPSFETFDAPLYDAPVSGVWYSSGEAACGVPLGGLGAGFVELLSDGRFGATTMYNNWLSPQPVGEGSGFVIRAGDRTADLTAGAEAHGLPLRFWGHWPAADIDFGDSFGPVRLYLRAYSPVIPHDYAVSDLPAAVFHFTAKNTGTEPVPLEIGLQYRADRDEVLGNVEGALGWRRSALKPGETWTVMPILVFGANDEALADALSELSSTPEALAPKAAPEGAAYAHGDVTDFLLDAFGGFNWETHRRGSAVFREKPQISQVFWQVDYSGKRAGRGFNGKYGLQGDSLPSRTEDGALEVAHRVVAVGANAFGLVYEFKNVSEAELKDLNFGLAANVDAGGGDNAPNGRVRFREQDGAVYFGGKDAGAVALAGNPDVYHIGTWPEVHETMARNDLRRSAAPGSLTYTRDNAGNLQMAELSQGSVAVGRVADDAWGAGTRAPAPGLVGAGAVRTLAPGETTEIAFALGWYFPEWDSSDGERLRHRYADGRRNAGDVVASALTGWMENEKAVARWQEKVYRADVPASLKDSVINSLYVLAKNSWWLDDRRFFQSESFTGCPITETFVCRFNGSFPLALMWPELEKATMREVVRHQGENGQIPFGFGTPMGTQTPMMHLQIPIVSTEFVLTAWRDYALWKDDAYLAETYPAAVKALRFAMTLDKDDDGLVNEAPGSEEGFPANQYYDIWPWWGTSAYTASISLAAWRAGEEMAKRQGDEAFAEELRERYERGAKSFEEKLWTGSYYRLYSGDEKHPASDTSLTNALCGQWFAYASDLGALLPRDRIDKTVDTVLRLNVPASPYGAVNGVTPEGKPDTSFKDHSAVMTIGEVWNFCAMAAFQGREEEALRLFETSYGNVALRQKTPWNIPWSLDPETGAIKWGINYYSNPCVWTLFQALAPEAYAELNNTQAKIPNP